MAYDEEEQSRSRVVVETPTTRREHEVIHRERVPERNGMSTGMVAAVALTAIALTAIVFLFLMNREPATNANINVQTRPTTAPTQPPVVYTQPQQPPPVITQPAPVITQPMPPTTAPAAPPATAPAPAAPAGPDAATVQADLNRKILEDTELSAANSNITATVTNGRAVLTGTVTTERMRNRARQVALTVRGVRQVDVTQLTVTSDMTAPPSSPE